MDGMKPRVLVACEYSGVVRNAFAKFGCDAWSCDLIPTESPGNHITRDVLRVLDDGWDLMVAHPPCTYLCSSGIHWNKVDTNRDKKTAEALEFARTLLNCSIPRICLENPVGILGTNLRPPNQIIQPYEFGEDASKKTCLWLKCLPPLKPTKYIEPRMVDGLPRWANQTDSGQNVLGKSPDRGHLRSKTYKGIAEAMANQWTLLLKPQSFK